MDLLERDRELAALDGLILDAKAGESRLALIEGPAGIGKTQLVGQLRDRAASAGMRVLSARGSQLEREFAFGVVRQLFEPVLDDEVLSGAAEAARPVFGSLEVAPGGTGDGSFATLHGLYWLALNLADRGPLLIAVDDLHWVDRASVRFLAYLQRRIEGQTILLAAGLRTAEPGTDPELLAEIVHDPATQPVNPGPLSLEGSAVLVRELLGDTSEPEFASACHESTGGNPLLLRQLLNALAAEGVRPLDRHAGVVREIGPRAVSRTVVLRLARLSPEAKAVARAVAVLGDDAALHAVAPLADIDEPSAARATGELARAEILRPGSPLGFVHPLVRDAIYGELSPGERELQHERAARMLLDAGAPLEQVAAHLLQRAPRGEAWVAELLQEAGREAMRKGAADSAPAYLRRALDEPVAAEGRPQLLLELGLAEILTDGPAALTHLRQAYDTLREPLVRAIAAAVLGRVVMFTSNPEEASALVAHAAAGLPPELEDVRRGLMAFERTTHFFSERYTEYLGIHEASRTPVAPGSPTGEKMVAAVDASYWAFAGGLSADECAQLSLAALEGGDLMRADNALLTIAAIRPLVLADRREALQAWDESLAYAHRRGSVFELAGLHLWRGFTQFWHGELADAEATLRTALDELNRWGFRAEGAWYCQAYLGMTLVGRGRIVEAREILELGRDGGATSRSDAGCAWQHAWIVLLLAERRFEEAVAAAEECGRRFAAHGCVADAPWRSYMGFALHRLGRDDEAEAIVLEELELAREWGAPGTVGRTLRTLGRARGEAGIADLEESVRLLAGSEARLEHAWSASALGTALRRFGRPAEAREQLQEAHDLARQCDADLVADEVMGELQAMGLRVGASTAGGVGSLTPSERRVANLAAAGGTNRDIAQELYVTPKTVEVHLSNAYRKLGIRGRRDLPQVLAA